MTMALIRLTGGSRGAWLVVLLSAVTISVTRALVVIDVMSNRSSSPLWQCYPTTANFGADVESLTVTEWANGCAIPTFPADACSPVQIPKSYNSCAVNFAVVPRANCSFSEQAYFVQEAYRLGSDYKAIIVFSDEDEPPFNMTGGKYADKVTIPIVMVSYTCMIALMDTFPASQGYSVHFKLQSYVGLVLVGVVIMAFAVYLLVDWCQVRRNRLLSQGLASQVIQERASTPIYPRPAIEIPKKAFQTGDEPDACAICFEDFIHGEEVGVLPCNHLYHSNCIETWLEQRDYQTKCPICKRRVGPRNYDSSDSDDDSTRNRLPAGPPVEHRIASSSFENRSLVVQQTASSRTNESEDEEQRSGGENAEPSWTSFNLLRGLLTGMMQSRRDGSMPLVNETEAESVEESGSGGRDNQAFAREAGGGLEGSLAAPQSERNATDTDLGGVAVNFHD